MIGLSGQGKTKGTVALLECETSCSQSLAGITPNTGRLDSKFLLYYLESRYRLIRGLVGEQRDGLNLQIVGDIRVPIPDYQEQKILGNTVELRTK